MKRVGIIGGLGSHAGADIVNRLNTMSVQDKIDAKDSDFPEVLYWQYPFQDVDSSGCTNSDDKMRHSILNISQTLEQYCHIDSLLFSCNTYNYLLDDYDKNISLYEIFESIKNDLFCNDFVVLASSQYVNNIHVNNSNKPSKSAQNIIDSIIQDTITHGFTEDSARRLKSFILSKKCKHVIIACTELSMYYHYLLNNQGHDFMVYDTVEEALKIIVKGGNGEN